MVKVLFVCLGNICRSPLAEALFQQKIEESALGKFISCDSCGTSNYHIGEKADPRTRNNAAENGIIITHRARQFSVTDFTAFDYIIPMDSSNLSKLKALENGQSTYILKKMRTFESDKNDINSDVPDPYFGGEGGFQEVFEILDRCTEHLLKEIIKTHNFSTP